MAIQERSMLLLHPNSTHTYTHLSFVENGHHRQPPCFVVVHQVLVRVTVNFHHLRTVNTRDSKARLLRHGKRSHDCESLLIHSSGEVDFVQSVNERGLVSSRQRHLPPRLSATNREALTSPWLLLRPTPALSMALIASTPSSPTGNAPGLSGSD